MASNVNPTGYDSSGGMVSWVHNQIYVLSEYLARIQGQPDARRRELANQEQELKIKILALEAQKRELEVKALHDQQQQTRAK